MLQSVHDYAMLPKPRTVRHTTVRLNHERCLGHKGARASHKIVDFITFCEPILGAIFYFLLGNSQVAILRFILGSFRDL